MSIGSNPSLAADFTGQTLRAGMRVVVVAEDASVRESLLGAFAEDAAFLLVGSAQRMVDAEPIIDEYVPEVVVCQAEAMADWQPTSSETLVLNISFKNGEVVLRRFDGEYEFSMNRSQLARSLAAIKGEVLFRKGEWLRHLVSSASVTSNKRRDDAPEAILPLTVRHCEDIAWVRSDGNYVLYYGNSGMWKERGSLSMLRWSHPACHFLRISRSCAVNRSQIKRVLRQENRLVISMKCGTVLSPSRSYLRAILQAVPDLIETRAS